MHAYKIAGLPGCIGSVDNVHVEWDTCHSLKNQTTCGKNGKRSQEFFK